MAKLRPGLGPGPNVNCWRLGKVNLAWQNHRSYKLLGYRPRHRSRPTALVCMHNLQRTNLQDLTLIYWLGPGDLASQVYMINCFKATPKLQGSQDLSSIIKHYQVRQNLHTYIYLIFVTAGQVWQLIKS